MSECPHNRVKGHKGQWWCQWCSQWFMPKTRAAAEEFIREDDRFKAQMKEFDDRVAQAEQQVMTHE